ncbi:excinuclease ABC subunit UvrC [Clostridium aminobutyricum]|uniref:UvrABC system protein C n=1 Tax=Clostridium aminobutyricum TaxID=33953 RepID=A0A939D9W1_CLOAM|nr:excinuclease ABC subunit UvrC [Clostridium aminobutyricum]MBN7773780.1 excinuclease ABC subunit C [Clostridium aminobutyricum]
MFDIKENLKKLPDSPGVYIHKDKLGQVIYVGKAISLKNRVRQYFQSPKNMPAKVRAMVSHIEEFEYITTQTEMEALILECTLIKRYMPKYNVLLRDDKTYPYIKITLNEEFPRLIKTRRIEKDGGKYFGPYTDVGAVNQMIDFLNNIFAFKRCSARRFPEDAKTCLNYHIHQCQGICAGNADRGRYLENVNQAIEFLNGKTKPLISELTERMIRESELLHFEKAAEYRDYIEAAKSITEKQHVVMLGLKDLDIVLAISSGQKSYAILFYVRNGKLSGRENFEMEGTDDKAELVGEFIKQHYSENPNIPHEILVEQPLQEKELIEVFLGELAGRQVKITVPQRGDKRDLLKLAQHDSIEMLKTIDEKVNNQLARKSALSQALSDLIVKIQGESYLTVLGSGQENPLSAGGNTSVQSWKDYRVEAYDISNTNGVDSVGAMVVFEGLKPNKKEYRRFKIRTVEGPNDYGSMQEVIYRRFKRAMEGDPAFKTMPDLLFIDGGKGQVSAVEQILAAMKCQISVVGMAKDDKHRSRALIFKPKGKSEYEEVLLKENPLLYKYTGAIQEEVHRFAIDYHRGLRDKKMQGSALDEIRGIGAQRRNALLAHFGSIEKIKNATTEELCAISGITEQVAKNIREYFH